MADATLEVRIPGKLMVAGEYAVLEPNHEAIVVAVDRYITATIQPSDKNCLYSPGLGLTDMSWSFHEGTVQFANCDSRLRYIERALAVVLDFLQEQRIEIRPFSLKIDSELDDPSGRKYGLGSSAAVVVAIISAVLGLFHSGADAKEVNHDLVFRLCAIAHFAAQGSGSGADIAASTFGGWLRYASFDSEWMSQQLRETKHPSLLIREIWPNLSVKRIIPPSALKLCVGWTGEPAATAPLVQKVRDMKSHHPMEYHRFLTASTAAVGSLVEAFEMQNMNLAIDAFEQNRVALANLGKQAGILIETPLLYRLHELAKELGGAGKPSGAGGGDCGIALVIGESLTHELFGVWREAGIEPLDISVSYRGAQIE